MTRDTLAACDIRLKARGDPSRCQLLGFDDLADTSGRPWLTEIDAWPNFDWRDRAIQRAIKHRLMTDFAAVVDGLLDGAVSDWGQFTAL